MSEYAQREFEAYRADDSAIRAILDRASEEKRSTTAEEDEQLDKLWESASRHKKLADKLASHEAESADMAQLAEAVRARIGEPSDPSSGDPNGDKAGDPFREAIRAAQQHILGAGVGTFTERVFTAPEDPSAWSKPLHEAVESVRAITNFGNGSTLWVADFSTSVAVYQRTASPWFNIASIINADNGRELRLPTVTADPTAYTPGEGTAITPADATHSTATLTTTAYKELNYISAEAEEDEVIGYLPIITRVQGRALGLAAGNGFTTSILAGAANGGTATGAGGAGTATNTFFGYEDLISLKYGRAAPYRSTGVYVMANGAIQKVRKFKDQNGSYFFQPAIGPGMPDMFDGNPVYEDPNLATPASATKSILFGDPKSVVIKQVPLRVAVSTEFAFNLDNVAIKSVLRAGAVVWDQPGIAYLISANT
jgi:HK97 family phage major capsid protein